MDVPVEVDTSEPVWTWDALKGADTSGALVYSPSSFSRVQHGLEKSAVIGTRDICAVSGWSVALVEDASTLPQEGQGKTFGGRHQLETNRTPNDYLSTLKGSQYRQETGFTPEDFLVKFATHLEETNQISHDWSDNSAAWLVGAYHKTEASVPLAYWYQGFR